MTASAGPGGTPGPDPSGTGNGATGEPGTGTAGTGRRSGVRGRVGRRAVLVAPLLLLAGAVGWVWSRDDEEGSVAPDAVTGGNGASAVGGAELERVARTRVFFGHQSVGYNILAGVPAVYAEHGVAAPVTGHGREAPSGPGFLLDTQIGENTKPLDKIRDFDAAVRGGLGRQVDVALMKFCYIDVTPGTDVEAVFAAYRDTLTALRRDFPGVAFVPVTVPLTTRPDAVSRLKAWVKGEDGYGAAANVARERLNELLRRQYGGDLLFDLAAVESTAPDGSRVSGRAGGRPYFALHPGYAADTGHLNAEGSKRAAQAMLAVLARASAR